MTVSTTMTAMEALEAARGLAPTIEALRADGERERQLPRGIVEALREAGLLRLWTPRAYGGEELPLPGFLRVVEELSRLDAATGWVYANLGASGMIAAFLDPAGARELYAGGPDQAGAGTANPKGRAVPVEGGYRVSGQWPLVSGCHHASWIAVGALVFDGDGPRMSPAGGPDIQLMALPAHEVTILDTWDSLGLRGTGSTDVRVEEAFVPTERAFPAFGLPRASGAMYRAGILPLFSYSVTTVGLGIARAAIDAFVEIAEVKTPAMSQSPLASRPTVHAAIARAEASLAAARAFFFETAEEVMASLEATGAVPEALEARRRLATAYCGEACAEVVDAMFRLAGATGVYRGQRLEQLMRDMHTASQHAFVAPSWWEQTGRFYLGQGLGMP